jgi:uncharacterized protein (DUF2147 family)
MIKKFSHILLAIFFLTGSLYADVVGTWKTIDDKSGQVRSTVEIYEQGGKLFGKIASLTEPNEKDGSPKICTKCEGAEKDKPVVGLVIIKGLSKDGDEYSGGTIMDPESGKVYKCVLWLDGGNLKVRGKLGPFFRTQTWKK